MLCTPLSTAQRCSSTLGSHGRHQPLILAASVHSRPCGHLQPTPLSTRSTFGRLRGIQFQGIRRGPCSQLASLSVEQFLPCSKKKLARVKTARGCWVPIGTACSLPPSSLLSAGPARTRLWGFGPLRGIASRSRRRVLLGPLELFHRQGHTGFT